MRTTRRPARGRKAARLRSERRRRRVFGVQPDHRQLRARQRGVGAGRRAGNASWYNANPGTHGLTTQDSNAYGRWGSSTISGPNQTVHTQSQSDARAAPGRSLVVGRARGGRVGCGRQQAGAVKTPAATSTRAPTATSTRRPTTAGRSPAARAGAPVTPPSTDSNPRAAGQQADSRADPQARPGAAEARRGPGAEGSGGWQQLENDRAAREEGGAERQRQFSGQAGRLGGGFQRRR